MFRERPLKWIAPIYQSRGVVKPGLTVSGQHVQRPPADTHRFCFRAMTRTARMLSEPQVFAQDLGATPSGIALMQLAYVSSVHTFLPKEKDMTRRISAISTFWNHGMWYVATQKKNTKNFWQPKNHSTFGIRHVAFEERFPWLPCRKANRGDGFGPMAWGFCGASAGPVGRLRLDPKCEEMPFHRRQSECLPRGGWFEMCLLFLPLRHGGWANSLSSQLLTGTP